MRAVLAALLLLGAGASRAADIPELLRGTWTEGGCAAPAAALHVTARSVVQMRPPGEQRDEQRLWRAQAVSAAAGWTVATTGGPEQPRLLLRRTPAGLEFALAGPKLRDDQLPGAPEPALLVPCPALPLPMAALHGEGIAFLQGLEALEPPCGAGEGAACVAAFMAYADVTRDGRLAPAELARALRGAVWAVRMADGTTPEALAAGLAVALVPGTLAARVLVEALDYEGRGSIAAGALLLDRAPFPPGAPPRPAEAPPLALERLGAGLGPLADLFGSLPALLRASAP